MLVYTFALSDIVKFTVKPTATVFVPIAYEPATTESKGAPATSVDDCVIRCHEDKFCGAVLFARQPDSFGNNCRLFQKRITK